VKRRDALNALAALSAAVWQPVPAAPAAAGEAVNWPEVLLLDGRRWNAASAAGQAVVVVFWSTTCPFCRRHNPHVEKLHRAAAGQGLTVLGVAREQDAEAVRRHAAAMGYSFPITLDHVPMAAALSARKVLPLTVTVRRDGRLHQVIPGEMFEADVLGLLKLAA
jgi:thiol-disulfide isomerase/thioredoxin